MTRVIAFLILATLIGSALQAGQLSQELSDRVAGERSDAMIPVWIKVESSESVLAIKGISTRFSERRDERYRFAVNRLKTVHEQAQGPLAAFLQRMTIDGKSRNLKRHWLVNIIEIEVAAGELARLADRNDIEVILSVPQVQTIQPDDSSPAPSSTNGVGSNITFVRANEAWAAGYTGAGRIVCSFDSGVDGDHPALNDRWKGHDGDSAAAWFDPRYNEMFPHAISGPSYIHGTHTMGTMVGRDNQTGDTIGVAPGADWISAGIIDVAGTSIIDAFEWAADPDGDPNSVDDLPDVINHSWGVPDIGCTNVFFDMIDATEALGIVNIFSAGNDGYSGSYSIRNPAIRANDSLDCFAIGNVSEGNPPVLASNSSLGPSDCNDAIKPNVCAPGMSIRSSIPGRGYTPLSGTSMSAPHVSGLVALLRQKNPDATVDQVKEAILTTARDYSYSLPDNSYGWGVIDCIAALNALPGPSAPNLRVYAFDHELIQPGDTVYGTLTLQNTGTAVSGVSAVITGSDPSLTVLSGSASFGNIGGGTTSTSGNILSVIVSDTITQGSVLSLDMNLSGVGYNRTAKLFFLVEPRQHRSFVTHDTGSIEFSVSNFGSYGLGPNSFFDAGGAGFRYDTLENEIWEAGLMVTTSLGSVSDGVRNAGQEPDGDFGVMPGGDMEIFSPGQAGSQETYSRFDDSRAESPVGLQITQHTFAFDSVQYDDYIILQYEVTNSNTYPLSGVYAGLYLDWDIVSYGSNSGGYDAGGEFSWTAYRDFDSVYQYRGCLVLDGPNGGSHTALGTDAYFPEGFTESEKRAALTSGFTTADTYKNIRADLIQVVSAGPIILSAGQTDTVAFALIAGASWDEVTAAATEARLTYPLLNECCVGRRGNINNDPNQGVDISDVVYLVEYLWAGGPAAECIREANLTGAEGQIDLSDLTYLVEYLWSGGSAIPDCQ